MLPTTFQRDYRRQGAALWQRFNPEAGQSGTLGYYRALADIYKRRLPGPLADDLDLAVGDLEKLTHEPGQWTG